MRTKNGISSRAVIAGPPRPIAVDLFSGVGGMSLGFEQAGFDVMAALEYDPIHAAVHSYNFPRTQVICADASASRRVTPRVLREAIRKGLCKHGRDPGAWDGQIDVVFGGPPCQGFSMMGKREIHDTRNNLIFHFERIVRGLQPRYFVMENVPGITAGKQGGLLVKLVSKLAAIGYNVPEPQVLNAKDFGVPQDRRRVILMGSRADCCAVQPPQHSVHAVHKMGLLGKNASNGLPRGPTVWEAIRDLPDVDRHRKLYKCDEIAISQPKLRHLVAIASPYAKLLRGRATDPYDYSHPRVWNSAVLANSMLTVHEPRVIRRFKATPKGGTELISRFHRPHPDGLSNTLRAGTAPDRGGYTSARPIHPRKNRVITVREAARIHSFPDWFRFHRTRWHGFRQIGNSVPPLFSRALASTVVEALGVNPVRPKRSIQLGDAELLTMNHTQAAEYFEALRETE